MPELTWEPKSNPGPHAYTVGPLPTEPSKAQFPHAVVSEVYRGEGGGVGQAGMGKLNKLPFLPESL